MEDVNISKFRAQVVRSGSTPASPGFVVSEGQNPVDPSGSGQNHLPVTIATASTGLSITDAQVLGGAGTVGQYIRGDGSLADFPATTGGGSSVSYYLNGSVSQGTIGGVAYKELNRTPVFGAGTDISINADGYIASFITDALDPNKLLIPAGNWNFETYFSASSNGGSPSFYIELYKYNGTTFTLIATSSSAPELIAFGTNLNPYFSTLAVPETVLALTDRLAVRFYVSHSGRTITLHTENDHLCQVITTFTTGLTALNGLTSQVQFFAVGTSGTDFAISSATDTHTFNLPTASATNRGALSSADWTTFNGKENAITAGTTAQYFRGDKTFQTLNTSVVPELTNLYYTEARVNANTNVAANTAARHNAVTLGTANGLSLSTQVLSLGLASAGVTGALSGTDWTTFNGKQNALTNPVTGTGTSGQVAYFTGTSAISSESNLFWDATNDRLGIGTNIPNDLLEIKSTIANQANYRLYNTFNDGANSFGINWFRNYDSATNSQAAFINYNRLGGSTGELIFGIGAVGAISRKMTLTASGRLLINTPTESTFELDVNGTGRFSGNVAVSASSVTLSYGTGIQIGNGTTDNGIRFNVGSGGWGFTEFFQGSTAKFIAGYRDANNTYNIKSGNDLGGSNGITITSVGNVGIGTASPVFTLHAKAASGSTTGIRLESSGGTTNFDILSSEGDGNVYLYQRSNYGILIGTNNSLRMTITSGGNVQVMSAGQLQVFRSDNTRSGLFYCNNSAAIVEASTDPLRLSTPDRIEFYPGSTEKMRISSAGVVTITNLGTGTVTSTAGVLSAVSDSSLKVDDGFIDSAIDKVLNLKPRYFYWNEKSGLPTDIRQLGFYAQEVNESIGEEAANTPKDKNTPWGITDRSIIAMLTKAIQELKQEIDTLKN
jgi:hypothetical protein